MIEARELRKSYGEREAVHGVSFVAETGSVLGLLGPNGAGKTTIMKVLTGYHFPSSGTVLVDGVDVVEDSLAVKRRVGYLPESVPLYQDLSTAEYLDFAADSRGLEGSARRAAIERSVESCGLAPVYRRTVEELSKGFRQRLGLAQAILHDPPILILDEPTTGLDPNQIIEIRALIRELGHEKTVILSTHILQEVEAVCSRVIILNEGTIAAQGRPEEIGETLKGEERVRLRVKSSRSNEPLDAGRLESLFTRLSSLRSAADLHQDTLSGVFSAELVFAPAAGEPGEILFDWAVANDLKLLELERRRLSLEEIFVKLTSEGGTK
ncbi:MAG: ATP-binding cassette domain-containing protein [Rectinemataceae bacterium]